MATIDRAGIAERLRGVLGGQDQGDLSRTATRLGLEEASLRVSLDSKSPHPTVEVLAAVVRAYGVDPTWLMTGRYDAATHRNAMETGDPVETVRELMGVRSASIAEPPSGPRLFYDNG